MFQRPRPQLPWATIQPEYSFPSGHSMNSLVFYLALALIAWLVFGRRIGALAALAAVAVALLVGTSRIYLGYHYFSDVAGGLLAGLAWLLIVAVAFEVLPALVQRDGRSARSDGDANPGRAPFG